MRADLRTFAQRLLKIVTQDGTIAEFARKHNITDSLLRAYLNGKTLPKLDALIRIAESAGVRVQWLATGEGPISIKPSLGEVLNNNAQIVLAEGAHIGEFISIPMVRGTISAGGGSSPNNKVEMTVAFQKEWLVRKGNPRNMSVIRIHGDSMHPTLESGDIVLVNHEIRSITSSGGLYAIAVQDDIMIKRIVASIPEGKLHVVSDNKIYPELIADAESVVINGKAIWYGRDLER